MLRAPVPPERRPSTARRRGRLVPLAVLLALAAACGGGDSDRAGDTGSSSSSGTASTAVVTTTAPPASTVVSTTTIGGPTTTADPKAFRLAALGDSYSAGLGATTAMQQFPECKRDPVSSVGALVADRLRRSGRPVALDLRACDGGTIADVLAKQLPGMADADAIVVSMGGNDLGFRRILTECLSGGCRSYDQPGDSFPAFTGEPGRRDWDVLADRIVDGLDRLRAKVRPGGTVYVLTYPIPFPALPDPACLAIRASLDATSRNLANAVADRLDETIVAAAARVNQRAGSTVVRVVEWRTGLDAPTRAVTDATGVTRTIRDNPDGICSPQPMVNGIVGGELTDSFHPTDRGHAYAADAVVRAITG
jgi:lysophospholipase L1-like esterase